MLWLSNQTKSQVKNLYSIKKTLILDALSKSTGPDLTTKPDPTRREVARLPRKGGKHPAAHNLTLRVHRRRRVVEFFTGLGRVRFRRLGRIKRLVANYIKKLRIAARVPSWFYINKYKSTIGGPKLATIKNPHSIFTSHGMSPEQNPQRVLALKNMVTLLPTKVGYTTKSKEVVTDSVEVRLSRDRRTIKHLVSLGMTKATKKKMMGLHKSFEANERWLQAIIDSARSKRLVLEWAKYRWSKKAVPVNKLTEVEPMGIYQAESRIDVRLASATEMAWGDAQRSGDYRAWVRTQTTAFRQSKSNRGRLPTNSFLPAFIAPQHEPLLKGFKTKYKSKSYASAYMMATAERIGVTKPYVTKRCSQFALKKPTNIPHGRLLNNQNLLLRSKLALFWDEDADSFKEIINETPELLPTKTTHNLFQHRSRFRQKWTVRSRKVDLRKKYFYRTKMNLFRRFRAAFKKPKPLRRNKRTYRFLIEYKGYPHLRARKILRRRRSNKIFPTRHKEFRFGESLKSLYFKQINQDSRFVRSWNFVPEVRTTGGWIKTTKFKYIFKKKPPYRYETPKHTNTGLTMSVLDKKRVLGRTYNNINARSGKWGFINARYELRAVSRLLHTNRAGIDRWVTPDYYDMIPETAKLTYDEEFGRVRKSGKAYRKLRKVRKRIIRYLRKWRMFFFTKRLSIDKLPNLGTLPKKPNPKTHTSQTLLQTYEAFPWCPKVPKLKIVKQILAIKKRKKNTERWYKYKQYRFMGRLLFKKNKHHNYMNHSTALASLERMNGRSVFWTRQITNRLINRKVRAFGKNQKTYFRWIWQRGNNMGSTPQKTKINVPIRHLPTDVQRIHKSTPPRPIPTGKTGCNSDSTPKNPMVGGMSTLRKNHIIRTATRKLKRGYKKLNNMANILHHLMRNLHTDRKYTTKKITHNPIKYRKIAERLFTRNPCKGIKVTKFKTRPTFVRAPYRKTSLRDITSYLMKSTRRLGTYQKTISPNRPAAFGKDRTPRLLTGPLSLGNKNSSLFICKNLRLKKPARQYIKTMKRYAIIIKPHQKRLLRYSRLIFSTLLMLVSKDLTLLTEYVFSIYKRQPYFRHRKIFYALRKLLKVVFSEGNRLFGLEGISFKLKGKVAVRGGLRKRVFKVRHGEYSSANTNRIHKYRFKQLWTKGGAVSLKVSILHK